MKFLANENFPLTSVRLLRESGLTIVAIAEEMAGAKDSAVLSRAVIEGLKLEGKFTVVDRQRVRQRPLPGEK